MTYDQIIDEIRELRLKRDQSDARLLLRLVDIERDHMDVIAEGGCATFGQFLKSLDSIVDPSRYDGFKAGLRAIGEAAAMECGADATIEAGRLTDNGMAPAYTQAIRDWSADHGGTLPTRQTAHKLLTQVDPRSEVPDSTRRQNELAMLRAENQRLRAENNTLRRRLAKYEAKAKAAA